MKLKIPFTTALFCMVTGFVFYGCTKEAAVSADGSGKGGSLARFTIAGNYLYTVDNHYLSAYTLVDPAKPSRVFRSAMNFDIETIYPFGKNLFLGTRTGLYIYSIDTPFAPRLVGQAQHARSCDPVVANDSVAFVTLKGTTVCGPATSGLYVHDIKNMMQPMLKTTISLPDPVGLGLQDSILYICCGSAGLKVFNVKSPYAPKLISTKTEGNFVDVIPYNNLLICYVQDGMVLYNIVDPANPVFIKKIIN